MSKNTTIEKYELKNSKKRYHFQIYMEIDSLTDKEKRTRRLNFKRSLTVAATSLATVCRNYM